MKKKREHFVTCGQMKVLEKRANAEGLTYLRMMERAGSGAAESIMELAGYRKVMNRVGGLRGSETSTAVADSVSTAQFNNKNIAKDIETPNDSPNDDASATKEADKLSLEDIAAFGIDDAEKHSYKFDGNATDSKRSDKLYFADIAASGMRDIENHSDKSGSTTGGMRTVIFCGKGNNGGDGFVAARILSSAGYDVTVVLVDGEPKSESALTNFRMLAELPVKILDMTADNSALMKLKGTPDIIVDAIYGTGFHGELKSNALRAAIYINRFAASDIGTGKTVIFALDIPSGMGGDLVDKKELGLNSVKANYTITFHARKPVHLQKFAEEYCGRVIVVDIGIDEERLWNVEY